MRLRLDGDERVGQALDLRASELDAQKLCAMIRAPANDVLTVPPPGPLHEHVGVIRPGMAIDRGAAIATAGRSLDLEPPQRDAIERLNREIEGIETDMPDLRAARRRVATAGADCKALEEQVTKTSGRLQARKEADLPTEEIEKRLADLTRQLTEAETEAIAAREALETAERRAASARDARARRLTLVDRRENRRREARQWFLDRLGDRFERAIRGLPIDAEPARPRSFDGTNQELALAVARLADVGAPIVLVESPFGSAARARASLNGPVVLTSV